MESAQWSETVSPSCNKSCSRTAAQGPVMFEVEHCLLFFMFYSNRRDLGNNDAVSGLITQRTHNAPLVGDVSFVLCCSIFEAC